jgi:hypothetical protein
VQSAVAVLEGEDAAREGEVVPFVWVQTFLRRKSGLALRSKPVTIHVDGPVEVSLCHLDLEVPHQFSKVVVI